LLQKKNDDNIKFVFPVVFTYNAKSKFCNNSEKKRFSSLSELFLKLKYLIDRDIDNKYSYINEVNKDDYFIVFCK